MTQLSVYIVDHLDLIVEEWEAFARTAGAVGRHLSPQDLRDHAKVVLMAVSQDMTRFQDAAQRHDKATGNLPDAAQTAVIRTSRLHAQHRFDQGFTLSEMVSEYRALRASVIRRWVEECGQTGTLDELTRFGEAIDEGLTESIAWYSKRLDDSRNLLVGMLAHDLRNPLQAVSFSVQFLLRGDTLEGAELRAANRIASSCARMTRYVSDLLDFSQTLLGTGLPLTRSSVDLGDLCTEIVDELRAGHPLVTIEFETAGSHVGSWDPARLSQLIGNLVANAVTHGDPAHPVCVSLRPGALGTAIVVSNHGAPIPEVVQATLFQPGARTPGPLDASRPPGSSGYGLGLYIVREIAVAHGGSVTAHSEAGSGTSFTVDLPLH